MTNKCVYLASLEPDAGKSAIARGLIESLSRQVGSVGIFRPIVSDDHDEVTAALLEQTDIDETYEEAVGMTADEAAADTDAALTTIIEQYGALQDRFDAVVIIGSDFDTSVVSTEFDFNARIAANLNAPILLLMVGDDKKPKEIASAARTAIRDITQNHDQVVGVIVNRVADDDVAATREVLDGLDVPFSAALPFNAVLAAPTVREQLDRLGSSAEVSHGDESKLDREVLSVIVGAMTLPNVLSHLSEDCAVLVPADRSEIVTGLLSAQESDAYPSMAAIYLTGDIDAPAQVTDLIAGLKNDVPIIRVKADTYTTAMKLRDVHVMALSNGRKNAEVLRLWEEAIDDDALLAAVDLPRAELRTPRLFEYQIMRKARADKKTIILPESEDRRVLEAASIVLARDVANVVLLGEPDTVTADAARYGFDVSGATIQSMHDPKLVEEFSAKYAELRAKKGVTIEQAREKMTDPSYFGTMMVYLGMADGMVSGATHTTANTIRPALEFVKTKPGTKVVSGSFLMCMPDSVLVFADCAVNPNPDAQALADIAISSAATARAFDIEPRVAMLSYSTGTSGKGVDVEAVQEATDILAASNPDFAYAGPIQFDAAIDPTVGQAKMPDSDVAGRATVFIFPDLNTGNNTYKAVQRTSGAIAIGPMLQGLNKPVNDLSRGALVDDIVNTVVITAIQAQTGI